MIHASYFIRKFLKPRSHLAQSSSISPIRDTVPNKPSQHMAALAFTLFASLLIMVLLCVTPHIAHASNWATDDWTTSSKDELVQLAGEQLAQAQADPSSNPTSITDFSNLYLGDPIAVSQYNLDSYFGNDDVHNTVGKLIAPIIQNNQVVAEFEISYNAACASWMLSPVTEGTAWDYARNHNTALKLVYEEIDGVDYGEYPQVPYGNPWIVASQEWVSYSHDFGSVLATGSMAGSLPTPLDTARNFHEANPFAHVDQITLARVNDWLLDTDGQWHYLDALGVRVIGWEFIDNTWYHFCSRGNLESGWQPIDGEWYYLNPHHDGTFGAMQTGWIYDDGWYYLTDTGAMARGWVQVYGSWYYLNEATDGTGGKMLTGWQALNGQWYYLYPSGEMAANTTVEGYTLGSDGAWIA